LELGALLLFECLRIYCPNGAISS